MSINRLKNHESQIQRRESTIELGQ